VSVNGTTFKQHNNIWQAERGRHGTLTRSGDDFVYTAKDGTRYYYAVPRRMEKVSWAWPPPPPCTWGTAW
jgi:HJR/Mrr/RecB family endonuclease